LFFFSILFAIHGKFYVLYGLVYSEDRMTFETFIRCTFIRSWWVIAFSLICTIAYEQGVKKWNALYQQLTEQSLSLQKEKQEALHHQENLRRQINSQSDLAWVELTLMKGSGLVPEGQQKVYFYQDER
jgi:hypothetical protein